MKFNSRRLRIASASLSLICSFASDGIAKPKQQSNTQEVPTADEPSLSVNEGVSELIYQKSAAASSTQTSAATVRVDSSVRIFFPSEFILSNKYFVVPYSANANSFAGFSVGPRASLASFAGAKVAAVSTLGFFYAQDIYEVQSTSGVSARDAVELQWIPIQTGLEFSTQPITRQRLVASFVTSIGIDWYTQNGQLDGMNQIFWVPRYEAGASISAFSAERPSDGGFDGIRLSAVSYGSFASSQANRGYAADLGIRYAF